MHNYREWMVMKNGRLWSDRFDSEDSAIEHMKECMEEDPGSNYTVEGMTDEEISKYDYEVS